MGNLFSSCKHTNLPCGASAVQGFPIRPVATAKAQEDSQCHNHGLAPNAQTMGEYSGCHRMSRLFVKPTGCYAHLGQDSCVELNHAKKLVSKWSIPQAPPTPLMNPNESNPFINLLQLARGMVYSVGLLDFSYRYYTYDSYLRYLPEDSRFACLIFSWRLNYATYCDHQSSERLGTQRFMLWIPTIPTTCCKNNTNVVITDYWYHHTYNEISYRVIPTSTFQPVSTRFNPFQLVSTVFNSFQPVSTCFNQ